MTPAAGDGGPRPRTVAVAAALILLVAYPLRYVLLPFALGGGLAFATSPAVRWLRARLRLPHLAAVLVVFTPTVAVCGALAYWVGLGLVRRADALADAAPRVLARLLETILGGDPARADATARQICRQLTDSLAPSGAAGLAVQAALGALAAAVLTVVLYFYFLSDAERLAGGMLWLVPPRWRDTVRSLALRTRPALRRYVVGVTVVVALTAAAAWVFLGPVLNMPDAGLLAVVTGLLELIPVVGPVASAALVSGAALDRGGVPMLLGFLLFYIVLRLVIDQVIGPLVLGRAVRLHPVVVLFAMLAGGALYGALGVFLAVPVAAVLQIVLREYYGEGETKKTPPAG